MKTLLAALLLLGTADALAAPKRILYVTHSAGFVHGSIQVSKRVMQNIAARNGTFEVLAAEDLSFLQADRLRGFDAVFFFTSGELAISDAQKRDLLEFVRAGKGFGGVHSATDTLYRWQEYGDLIGGYFDGHPWTQEVTIDIEDPDHPATRSLGTSFRLLEEIYQFRSWTRDSVRVLLTLDPRSVNLGAEGVNRRDEDFALAWCRPYGAGRVFYTALGHFDETWLDARFQRMLEDALLWMTGEVPGEGAPRKSAPVVSRVSNLAFESEEAVAPGMLVAITGTGLTTGSTMKAPQPFPRRIAGTQVRVNGVAAPLLSVSPDRVVAALPAELAGAASIAVVSGAVEQSVSRSVPVVAAVPGILGLTRTANIVSIFATGLGRETSGEVLAGGRSLEIEYLGPSPGLPGMEQINARIPDGLFPPFEVKLRVAGRDSNSEVVR